MSIAVIDQGAELFWFVSNALLQDELALKHLNSIQAGESFILQDLPKIVVINGDDTSIQPVKFIGKIRNHVFARSTLFIVVTTDTSPEFKKELIIAGASQILYRGKGYNPSPKFFRNLVKWFLNVNTPDPQVIEYKPVSFEIEGEFSTFGRIGWMSSAHCFIEVNLDLSVGQTVEMKNPLFDELDIKDAKLIVEEKNQVGRYYQYSNGYLCKIETKNTDRDRKKLQAWIESNQDISKHKPVKVLYFESDFDKREQIKGMIKSDQRYCARGFANLDTFAEQLDYQLPHLILIDRNLLNEARTKFEPIKKFMQSHFCYCVTYDNVGTTDIEEFKKTFDFAMHMPNILESTLLDSMVEKLEAKLLLTQKGKNPEKVYFNKYSPYSRMSLHSHCKVTELAISGLGLVLPFAMSTYCAFEIISQGFTHMSMNRMQYFRNFISKKATGGIYHQAIFIGQTVSENELIKITVDEIKATSFDQWKTKV